LVATGVDYIDEQNYCELHLLILGLSPRSIEQVLEQHAEQVELPYAKGRLARLWTAREGDRRAISVPLAQGANPNTVDIQNSGLVTNAADQGHTACVRLLFEAGGETDPVRSEKKGSPVNCAACNAHDPILIQTFPASGRTSKHVVSMASHY
jgi:ankyrin repeat protein